MSVHVTFSSKTRLLYFSVMACWVRTSSVARMPDKRRFFNFEPPAAEPSPLGPASGAAVVLKHRLEELAGDGVRQQPLAILREGRRGPHRCVHTEAHEPAEQQVVLELLDEQPLAPLGVEDLQQQVAERLLRTGPTRRRCLCIG